jgi:hypothetical protein
VKTYLMGRGLAAAVLDILHTAGRLYADFRSNAVFTHARPTGEITGCEKRGTGPEKWTGASGSKSGFFLEGTKPGLVIVESAIDALSCVQLTAMSAVSVGGANLVAAKEWAQWAQKQGMPVHAGQDRDNAGEAMAKALVASGATRLLPPLGAKDWSEAVEYKAKEQERMFALERELFLKETKQDRGKGMSR